jgi:hypothetical protein
MPTPGRPVVYQSEEEKPVTVSMRIPRDLYERAQRYVRQRPPMTMTELLLDGLRLRLETPTDPRDLILSDDNTVMRELQAMIDTAVQAALAKDLGRKTPDADTRPPTPASDHQDPTDPATETTQAERHLGIEAAAPPIRRRGRPSTMRQPILDLLQAHPEGLTAAQIKVYLDTDTNIGDTLQGMVRAGLLAKAGTGLAVRYTTKT